jgi:hypothetical protein
MLNSCDSSHHTANYLPHPSHCTRKTVNEIQTLLLTRQGHEASEDHANILFARLDRRGRMQISAELPLMYATGRRSEPPQVTFPVAEEAVSNRPPRARESQLETKPFLKALPVWKYARWTP